MYKVRFNLGRGKNYMKWKITYPSGAVRYYEPDAVTLYMFSCRLRNQKGAAKKIFDGANKTVCAWIECQDLEISKDVRPNHREHHEPIMYNPRKQPYWTFKGDNADGMKFDTINTIGRKLYDYCNVKECSFFFEQFKAKEDIEI